MLSASDWIIVGATGVSAPLSGTGFIERTTDAGIHWSTVFSSPRIWIDWIGRDGNSIVATGQTDETISRNGLDTGGQGPLLLRSNDGGLKFTLLYPRVPNQAWGAQFAFSGHGAAITVSNPILGEEGGPPPAAPGVLRSADDGRTWTMARLPGDGFAEADATWTAGGRVAYVAGYRSGHCANALWRSQDAGASWQLVPGACNRGSLGVAFPTASDGFIAAGDDPKFRSGQVVSATTDGGVRWHTVWRDEEQYGESAIVQLAFVDRDHGWAVPGGITAGANAAYIGDLLVTTDGGRHWRDTGQLANAVSAIAGGSALAIVASPFGRSGAAFAVTHNWGVSWKQLTPLVDVQTSALLGGQGWLTDVTDAGTFLSKDGGAHWTVLDPPQLDIHSTLIAAQPGLTATLDASNDRCALRLSSDGGERSRAVAPPGGTLGRIFVSPDYGGGGVISCQSQYETGFAFANRGNGFALAGNGQCGPAGPVPAPGVPASPATLYATSDGGITWRDLGRIARFAGFGSTTFNGGGASAAASGATDIVVGDCSQVAISHDRGKSWSVQGFPGTEGCTGAAAYAEELWLICASAQPPAEAIVYHSSNGGRTWNRYTSTQPAFMPDYIVATSSNQAVVSGSLDNGSQPGGTSLWRTSDGGKTWTQTWPDLPIGPNSSPARNA
jgi:photosystem II stability/assembly factor-like uncharacterized protein